MSSKNANFTEATHVKMSISQKLADSCSTQFSLKAGDNIFASSWSFDLFGSDIIVETCSVIWFFALHQDGRRGTSWANAPGYTEQLSPMAGVARETTLAASCPCLI